MKNIFLVAFITLLLCTNAFAAGKMSAAMQGYNYDNFKEITVYVEKVEHNADNPQISEKGLHVFGRTKSNSYVIHIAPQWFVNQEGIDFKVGETITVRGAEFINTGNKLDYNNIYAATVTSEKYKTPLKVRDEKTGTPLWKGKMKGEMKAKMQAEMQKKLAQQKATKATPAPKNTTETTAVPAKGQPNNANMQKQNSAKMQQAQQQKMQQDQQAQMQQQMMQKMQQQMMEQNRGMRGQGTPGGN